MKKNTCIKRTEDFQEHLEEFKRLCIFLDQNILYIQAYIDGHYSPIYEKIKPSAIRLFKSLLRTVKQKGDSSYEKEDLPGYIKELISEFYLLFIFDTQFCAFLADVWEKLQRKLGNPSFDLWQELLDSSEDIEWEEEDEMEDDEEEWEEEEEIPTECEQDIRFLWKTLRKLEAPIDPSDTCLLPEDITMDVEISFLEAPFPRSLFALWLSYLKRDLLLFSTLPVIRNQMSSKQIYKYQKGIQKRKEAKDYPALISLYFKWMTVILDKINQHPERVGKDLNHLVEVLETMTHKNTRQVICFPFTHTHYLLGTLLWKEQGEIQTLLERKETELLYHVKETETLCKIVNNPDMLRETILNEVKKNSEQDPNIHFSWS